MYGSRTHKKECSQLQNYGQYHSRQIISPPTSTHLFLISLFPPSSEDIQLQDYFKYSLPPANAFIMSRLGDLNWSSALLTLKIKQKYISYSWEIKNKWILKKKGKEKHSMWIGQWGHFQGVTKVVFQSVNWKWWSKWKGTGNGASLDIVETTGLFSIILSVDK